MLRDIVLLYSPRVVVSGERYYACLIRTVCELVLLLALLSVHDYIVRHDHCILVLMLVLVYYYWCI